MIFADKLITLRKKAGWSQEELAEKLGVTRQSVSKWEGAHRYPTSTKFAVSPSVRRDHRLLIKRGTGRAGIYRRG